MELVSHLPEDEMLGDDGLDGVTGPDVAVEDLALELSGILKSRILV